MTTITLLGIPLSFAGILGSSSRVLQCFQQDVDGLLHPIPRDKIYQPKEDKERESQIGVIFLFLAIKYKQDIASLSQMLLATLSMTLSI